MPDVNALIQQMMAQGGGGGAMPPSPQGQPGMTPSQAQPLDDGNAAALLEQLLQKIGPSPAGPEGPRTQDPYFAEAMEVFAKENGHEPASDGEFAEVEKIAVQLMQDKEQGHDMDNDGD